jgi:non-ribosomal peptide synthetase component F
MRPESTAFNVSERVDALAEALRAAGVPPERSAGLLASAATAAMHAVVLDALLDEATWVPAPVAAAEPAGEQPIVLAA